jgi:hypothetical protein
MRRIVILLALFLTRSAVAQEDATAKLLGSWRLVSFQLTIVGEEGAPKDIFGPAPFGRIIFSPDRSVIVFISRSDRRPPSNDAESAALLASMTAYTGKFRLEGNKFITQVDGAWNEVYRGGEQTRYFEFSGDRLIIRTPEQPSGILIGKRTVATLVWRRETP